MKLGTLRRLAQAAALLAVMFGGAAWAALEWREFRSPDGGFAVQMPGEPVREHQKVSGSETPNVLYGVKVGERNFVVSYLQYEATPASAAQGDRLLRHVEEAAVKGVNGALKSDRALTLAGNPGREAVIESGANTLRARYYLAGSRLYQVVFMGPKGQESAPDALRFLDSFRLIAH